MEIKFRLHDKNGNIIGYEEHLKNEHGCYQIYQTSLRGDFGGMSETQNVREGYFIAATHKSLSTGLKDRDGVEIYENDEIFFDYNYIGKIVVEYKKGAFNIFGYAIARGRIIGNILKEIDNG